LKNPDIGSNLNEMTFSSETMNHILKCWKKTTENSEFYIQGKYPSGMK